LISVIFEEHSDEKSLCYFRDFSLRSKRQNKDFPLFCETVRGAGLVTARTERPFFWFLRSAWERESDAPRHHYPDAERPLNIPTQSVETSIKQSFHFATGSYFRDFPLRLKRQNKDFPLFCETVRGAGLLRPSRPERPAAATAPL
jgi:hypothetical protein